MNVTVRTLMNPGSRVDRPDLDWSQVKETIAMLCLTMAQIETTLTESTHAVSTLTGSFLRMANESKKINVFCERNETAESWTQSRDEILCLSKDILQQVSMAVVAFQFYDRLSQKLGHVNGSLRHLGDLIGDTNRLFNPQEWRKIQDEVRSNYTMECERLMFDMIMKGSTIEEALMLYRHQFNATDEALQDKNDDQVELF